MPTLAEFLAHQDRRAAIGGDLDRYAAPVAAAIRDFAAGVRAAIAEDANAELTVEEGAREAGYSPRRIREMIAEKKIPKARETGPLRVRRADLPRKAAPKTTTEYDPRRDAMELLHRRSAG